MNELPKSNPSLVKMCMWVWRKNKSLSDVIKGTDSPTPTPVNDKAPGQVLAPPSGTSLFLPPSKHVEESQQSISFIRR